MYFKYCADWEILAKKNRLYPRQHKIIMINIY